MLLRQQNKTNSKGCYIRVKGLRNRGRKKPLYYGYVTYKRKTYSTHKVAYLQSVGMVEADIPTGHNISHLCHETRCFNPKHLTLEAIGTNNSRKPCLEAQFCLGHQCGVPDCIL